MPFPPPLPCNAFMIVCAWSSLVRDRNSQSPASTRIPQSPLHTGKRIGLQVITTCRPIPPTLAALVRSRSRSAAHHMPHRHIVPTPKPILVVPPQIARNIWMPVLIAVVHIRSSPILDIPPRTLYAIVKALPLCLPKLRRRRIPAASTIRSTGTLAVSIRRRSIWLSVLRIACSGTGEKSNG